MDKAKESLKLFRERQNANIDLMKERLALWMKAQNGPVPTDTDIPEHEFFGPYTEINAALLETAIDRMLVLLGGPDTREFLLNAYDRRVAAYRASLT